MNKEEFEKIMIEEYRNKYIDTFDCENPYFDKLYAIRKKLYNFFYPIAYVDNAIHDVVVLWKELQYGIEDDEPLSIVIAYTDMSDRDREFQLECMKKIKPDLKLKSRTDKDLFVDFFVVKGYSLELTEEYIKPIALQHCPDRKFIKFVAKHFTYEVLDFICGLKNRFDKAHELANEIEDRVIEQIFKSFKQGGYDYYRKETENMIVDFILNLEY